MKVFLSSLISGFEELRDAAAEGAMTLGHAVVRAEDFGASASSPQSACLGAARESDIVVLVLGERYGFEQPSGLSATHEEFREVRESHPILVFIEAGIEPEDRQLAFIREVQSWDSGLYTAEFSDSDSLRKLVVRALHDHELSAGSTTADDEEIERRAVALIPEPSGGFASPTQLVVAVAGGPARAVLSPSTLDDPELIKYLQAQTITGPNAVLDVGDGTTATAEGAAISLRQTHHRFRLFEDGSMVVEQPAMPARNAVGTASMLRSIIEEDLRERIETTISLIGTVLNHVDGPQRLSHVSVVAAIGGSAHVGWRTKAEAAANPNSMSLGMRQGEPNSVVRLSPSVRRRGVLLQDTARIADDITATLRRAVKA